MTVSRWSLGTPSVSSPEPKAFSSGPKYAFLEPVLRPALLSKRLKDLEEAGIVRRIASRAEAGVFEYHLTRSGRDLEGVVQVIGVWGQRWVESEPSLQNLDPDLLMWDMRRSLDPSPMPKRRSVIEFLYPELPAKRRRYWLLVAPGTDVDLCWTEL